MSKPDQSQLNLTVSSQTNAGTAGGTFYYINLGGIKMLWGQTAAISTPANGGAAGVVNFPASFFTTIQQIMAASSNNSGSANIYGSVDTVSTSSCRIVATNTSASATNATLSLFVIGT